MVSALTTGAGLVLTRALDGSGLMHWDSQAVRNLAANRSDLLVKVSWFWSELADGPTIVGVAIVLCALLAWKREWRDIAAVAGALALEFLVFLTASVAVDRPRPDVERLGSVPGTGSYPSGHISATIVLFGTATLLVRAHGGRRPLEIAGWSATAVAAALVGWARVYRGMHHPLDVGAGALVGCLSLLATRAAFLRGTSTRAGAPPGAAWTQAGTRPDDTYLGSAHPTEVAR
jgi:membrane-associated phospholipid phosphatase